MFTDIEVEHSNPPTSEVRVSYYHAINMKLKLICMLILPQLFKTLIGGRGITGSTGLPLESHRVMKNEQ